MNVQDCKQGEHHSEPTEDQEYHSKTTKQKDMAVAENDAACSPRRGTLTLEGGTGMCSPQGTLFQAKFQLRGSTFSSPFPAPEIPLQFFNALKTNLCRMRPNF